MQIQDIREKNREELQSALAEARESLRAIRFSLAQKEERRTSEHRRLRQDIARILTVLSESER